VSGEAGAGERQAHDRWCGRSGEVGEAGDSVGALLLSGAEHAHDPPLAFGSPVASVPAGGLAVHDFRSDAGLAPPVGGVDARLLKEGEQRGAFVGEMADQLAVLVVRVGLVEEQVETFADVGERGPAFVELRSRAATALRGRGRGTLPGVAIDERRPTRV
jgi:hypothetical protein